MEDLIGHPNFQALKKRTWSDVQVRAAALVPSDLISVLNGYYSSLGILLTLVGFANMTSDSFDRSLRGLIQEPRPEVSVAATRNPYREQLEKLLDAQESAQLQYKSYCHSTSW